MNKLISKLKDIITNIVIKIGDKNAHFICSFIIVFFIGLIDIMLGIFIGCAIGLAKELYDLFRYKIKGEGVGFDSEDLAYDFLGIIVAVVILIIF